MHLLQARATTCFFFAQRTCKATDHESIIKAKQIRDTCLDILTSSFRPSLTSVKAFEIKELSEEFVSLLESNGYDMDAIREEKAYRKVVAPTHWKKTFLARTRQCQVTLASLQKKLNGMVVTLEAKAGYS